MGGRRTLVQQLGKENDGNERDNGDQDHRRAQHLQEVEALTDLVIAGGLNRAEFLKRALLAFITFH